MKESIKLKDSSDQVHELSEEPTSEWKETFVDICDHVTIQNT